MASHTTIGGASPLCVLNLFAQTPMRRTAAKVVPYIYIIWGASLAPDDFCIREERKPAVCLASAFNSASINTIREACKRNNTVMTTALRVVRTIDN